MGPLGAHPRRISAEQVISADRRARNEPFATRTRSPEQIMPADFDWVPEPTADHVLDVVP
jgi:hypothetical protein